MTSFNIPGSLKAYDDKMDPVRTHYLIVKITSHDIPGSFKTFDDRMDPVTPGVPVGT